MDTKNALLGIFTQITTGDEATRERCFKFITTKLFAMGPSVITKEVEDFLIDEVKKVLQVSEMLNKPAEIVSLSGGLKSSNYY